MSAVVLPFRQRVTPAELDSLGRALAEQFALEAEADALSAVMRLRGMCSELIDNAPLTRENLAAFVEASKQCLHVVATSAPLVKR